MTHTDQHIRRELAYAYRLLALLGLDDHTYAHLSHRTTNPAHAFILEFGLRFEEVTPDNLLTLGGTEHQYNQTGFIIHGSVYQARPDVQCVFHLHTPEIIAVSALEEGLMPLSQWALHLYNTVGYYHYDSLTLVDEQGSDLITALSTHPVLLMRNHGALICGRTIQETMFFTHHLVQACKTQCLTLAQQRPLIMPSHDVCTRTRDDLLSFEEHLGERDWISWKRFVDRKMGF